MAGKKVTYYATGRRKASIARVWLGEGFKGISVNGQEMASGTAEAWTGRIDGRETK